MSIANASVQVAPTSITVTGGTALSFTPLSNTGTKVIVQNTADTDSRTRRKASFKVTSAVPEATAPNGYTQNRCEAKFTKPKLLANGKITTNEVIITMRSDVETTQTELQEMVDVGAQLFCDADFLNFWKVQALA